MVEKNVFFEFKDGSFRLFKIIELKDNSLKIIALGAPHEWTLHPDRFHLKKKSLDLWQDKDKKYMYVNCADYKNFNGVGGLCLQLHCNGINVPSSKPGEKDIVIKTDKNSNERICLYVGICRCSKEMMEENIKSNKVSVFEKIPFSFIDMIIGIKEGV